MSQPQHKLELVVLPGLFAVCRLAPREPLPGWALTSSFVSITRTPDELSLVCAQESVPAGIKTEADWRCLKVAGPLEFSLTGVLAALAVSLAEAGVSIFAISSYDTDYLLVKQAQLVQAIGALELAGHSVVDVHH